MEIISRSSKDPASQYFLPTFLYPFRHATCTELFQDAIQQIALGVVSHILTNFEMCLFPASLYEYFLRILNGG